MHLSKLSLQVTAAWSRMVKTYSSTCQGLAVSAKASLPHIFTGRICFHDMLQDCLSQGCWPCNADITIVLQSCETESLSDWTGLFIWTDQVDEP